jgi:zinc/manganese transport system substrate-binding protein
MYVAYGDNNDVKYNMPAVNDFMKTNGYGDVTWIKVSNPNRGWNTPETSKLLAAEVKGWLVNKTPSNKEYYEQRYGDYCKLLDAASPTADELMQLNKTEVIVMTWQREPVEKWLTMKVVNFYAPEFVMNGTKTAARLVDDINANSDRYRNVKYIIENMQSGELAKGVEEALKDKGINVKRVLFTNFPGSKPGTDTMADVLKSNKQLVLENAPAVSPSPTPSPLSEMAMVAGMMIGIAFVLRKYNR